MESRCLLRSVSSFIVEVDSDRVGTHAAEEISFSRTEGGEVTYPFLIGREVREAVVCLDQVTHRRMIVIVC